LKGGLSFITSSPVKERDTGCSSHSPIKPSIELERSIISVTKKNFDKGVFKLSEASISRIRAKRIPETPISVNFLYF